MRQTLKQYIDPELGLILFKYNSAARQYIIRCQANQIVITIPIRGKLATAEDFFAKNKAKLLLSRKKLEAKRRETPKAISMEEVNLLIDKANAYLPDRLKELAVKHGFNYRFCKIGKSRTAWGSCSTTGKIILSFYLMILPEELIEYVLLHELCHTVHANHSDAFWKLLNSHLDGKAIPLRKELKKYPIPCLDY